MLPHRQAGNYASVLLGTAISAFTLCNVHARAGLTEGGIYGITLLLRRQLGISPAVTEWLLDMTLLLLAARFFGGGFAKKSLAAVFAFSAFYALFEALPPMLPDLSSRPLTAAVLGAVLLSLGVGLVFRAGAACGGDDALAMLLSSRLHQPLSRIYLLTDGTVLALCSFFLPPVQLFCSLVSCVLSSLLLGRLQSGDESLAPLPAG